MYYTWGYTRAVSVLKEMEAGNHKFKSPLGNVTRPCFKNLKERIGSIMIIISKGLGTHRLINNNHLFALSSSFPLHTCLTSEVLSAIASKEPLCPWRMPISVTENQDKEKLIMSYFLPVSCWEKE